MAKFTYLDRESYQEIPIFYMSENNNGGLPFHIQKYTLRHATLLHRHDFMQINYIVNGSGEHIINGNAFPINTGDIFVIPPYVPHKISSSEPDSLKIFEFEFNTDFIVGCSDTEIDSSAYFDFAYLEPFLVSEHQVKPRLNLTGGLQVEVEAVLNEALEEYRQRRKGFALVIKSLLLRLLVLVGREFSQTVEEDFDLQSKYSYHHSVILKTIEYLKHNYHKNITLDDIAKRYNYSPSHFRYLFRCYTSKSFWEYLHYLRVAEAKRQLKETNDKVMDIAFNVGFNNLASFNRIFRAATNMTPSEYRKANR